MAIISVQVPNTLPSPFDTMDVFVDMVNLNVIDDQGEKDFYLNAKLRFMQGENDVTSGMDKGVKTVHIHNGKTMYVRDENFQPIPNPEYASKLAGNQLEPLLPNPNFVDYETTPEELENIPNPEYVSDEELALTTEFLEAPAFDYTMNLIRTHPAMIWDVLGLYILENYNDGYYDLL